MNKILLSVAIPTFNRGRWLELCLSQLVPQLNSVAGLVELNIYDNASPDNTKEVVESFLKNGARLNYQRNIENIGSDRNIAQCFNRAQGQYVLILGDDDVLLDGALLTIVNAIKKGRGEYGALYIRAYGYDKDFRKEKPFQFIKRHIVVPGADKFLSKCSSNIAFISSLVINKSKIQDLDANQFLGTALVQTYLLYESVRQAEKNLFIDQYLVAAKRIEQRDYDVTKIFSESLNDALDYFASKGLNLNTVRAINRKLLWYFYPIFLMNLRSNISPDVDFNDSYERLKTRYQYDPFFWLCAYPILKFPKHIGLLWGAALIVISRLINGEFGRLFVALKAKISSNV